MPVLEQSRQKDTPLQVLTIKQGEQRPGLKWPGFTRPGFTRPGFGGLVSAAWFHAAWFRSASFRRLGFGGLASNIVKLSPFPSCKDMLIALYNTRIEKIESVDNRFPKNSGMRNTLRYSPILTLVACAPLFAHHGTSVTYQTDKTITMTGTVTEFSFSYPHPQLYFDVKDAAGNMQHWGAEFGPTPLMMKDMHVGWSRDSIKPGDALTITCNPHRVAGSTACLAKELIVNGKKLPMAGPRPAPTGTAPGQEPAPGKE